MSWPKGKSRKKTAEAHHNLGKRLVIHSSLTIIVAIAGLILKYPFVILLTLIVLAQAIPKLFEGVEHFMYNRRKGF